MKPQIIFFGTPQIGKITLEKLIQASFQPVAVVTKEDKPAGRGKKPTPSPVKLLAQKHGIPIFQPVRLKENAEFINQLKDLAPDLGVVAAFGKILPGQILNLPRFGVLNVHPSLLPKFRGPSPIQFAILEGETETGVTIILMNEFVDEGDILASGKLKISSDDTTLTLTEKLAKAGSKLLIETIPKWVKGQISPTPQNHLKATYSAMLSKYDGKIDPENPPDPDKFSRMVRAFYPWPGVWTELKIKQSLFSRKLENKNEKLKIKFLPENKIQPEGKKPMSLKELLNGHPEARTWLEKLGLIE